MYRFPMARPAGDPLAPPALYERLRAEEPVAKATLSDGTEAWLVARYDEVRAVLRELPVSADITRPGFPKILPLMQALPPDVPPPFVLMDPPEHDAIRRLVNPDFVVKHVETLRPRIQRLVDERMGCTGASASTWLGWNSNSRIRRCYAESPH